MSLLVPDKPQVFERGDRLYITAPVQSFKPPESQVEEFAFTRNVKKEAPNENIAWLKGQYVEADEPNHNGAMWRAQDLAISHLTPLYMPVTVMHDPRTAVGTIADVALRTPDKDQVQRARLDTVLALWAHRFPDVMQEVSANLEQGSLMQSMECWSPWYECSACSMVFHKQPHGAERAQWCDHLKAGNPVLPGYQTARSAEPQTSAWRILGDVCFTGTGLIFGTRGAVGALSTANLTEWQDEVAEYHQRIHTDTARTARSHSMGLVQIEQSELDTLRRERDDARKRADDEKAARQDAEKKVEDAEAAKVRAETEKANAEKAKTDLEEKAAAAELKDKRMGELGEGFIAKLGDFTKSRLTEQAKTYSDQDWDDRLKELEESAGGVKRDAAKDGSEPAPAGGNGGPSAPAGGAPTFGDEEIARFVGRTTERQPSAAGAADPAQTSSVVSGLVRSFGKKATPAGAGK